MKAKLISNDSEDQSLQLFPITFPTAKEAFMKSTNNDTYAKFLKLKDIAREEIIKQATNEKENRFRRRWLCMDLEGHGEDEIALLIKHLKEYGYEVIYKTSVYAYDGSTRSVRCKLLEISWSKP